MMVLNAWILRFFPFIQFRTIEHSARIVNFSAKKKNLESENWIIRESYEYPSIYGKIL